MLAVGIALALAGDGTRVAVPPVGTGVAAQVPASAGLPAGTGTGVPVAVPVGRGTGVARHGAVRAGTGAGGPAAPPPGRAVGAPGPFPADEDFAEFARASYGGLRHAAYLLTGDRHVAEDAAQTALVRTYAAWSRVRRDDAYAYARKVLVNHVTDRWRRRLREYPSTGQPTATGSPPAPLPSSSP